MDSEKHVCAVCGQPVETVVRRHKTLGAWVPVWVPGPCRNPDCTAYGTPPEESPTPQSAHREGGTKAGTDPGNGGPGERPDADPGSAPSPKTR
ncbi:hypothetical protein MTQ10_03060 [Streptomyces sp. XM83C]|jgi:hypothetical protein|uniref:Uncharacterized protein n=1 Tax=Streptomyces thermocoprophilus TaxID=78356 RepID=A0ABV5VC73_9ACTN|nr:hypothetical protein [Streptomyces sp. XM83C]MCK1818606.1 hypothetical protein [Streptomyces sp. XM83C]